MDPLLPLKGIPTPPPPNLRHVQDLTYFDGPLLSHFKRIDTDDSYLYYWVDCDDKTNRWMILRVAPDTVQRLRGNEITLQYTIPGLCLDPYVCLVDMDNEQKVTQSVIVYLPRIPQDYLPGRDSYVQPVQQEQEPRSEAIPVLDPQHP